MNLISRKKKRNTKRDIGLDKSFQLVFNDLFLRCSLVVISIGQCIKHDRQGLMTFPKPSCTFIQSTPLRVVFPILFLVCGNVTEHSLSRWVEFLKQFYRLKTVPAI